MILSATLFVLFRQILHPPSRDDGNVRMIPRFISDPSPNTAPALLLDTPSPWIDCVLVSNDNNEPPLLSPSSILRRPTTPSCQMMKEEIRCSTSSQKSQHEKKLNELNEISSWRKLHKKRNYSKLQLFHPKETVMIRFIVSRSFVRKTKVATEEILLIRLDTTHTHTHTHKWKPFFNQSTVAYLYTSSKTKSVCNLVPQHHNTSHF